MKTIYDFHYSINHEKDAKQDKHTVHV
jgi:hypothetical protein